MSGVLYGPVRSGAAAVTFLPLYQQQQQQQQQKNRFSGLIPGCAVPCSKISVFLFSSGTVDLIDAVLLEARTNSVVHISVFA